MFGNKKSRFSQIYLVALCIFMFLGSWFVVLANSNPISSGNSGTFLDPAITEHCVPTANSTPTIVPTETIPPLMPDSSFQTEIEMDETCNYLPVVQKAESTPIASIEPTITLAPTETVPP